MRLKCITLFIQLFWLSLSVHTDNCAIFESSVDKITNELTQFLEQIGLNRITDETDEQMAIYSIVVKTCSISSENMVFGQSGTRWQ